MIAWLGFVSQCDTPAIVSILVGDIQGMILAVSSRGTYGLGYSRKQTLISIICTGILWPSPPIPLNHSLNDTCSSSAIKTMILRQTDNCPLYSSTSVTRRHFCIIDRRLDIKQRSCQRETAYMLSALYAIARPSIYLSVRHTCGSVRNGWSYDYEISTIPSL